jgi:hypothetical protein
MAYGGSIALETFCAMAMLVVLVTPSILFARLFKREHDGARDEWEKDGRPYGVPLWVPPGMGIRELHPLPSLVAYRWLLRTPAWVTRDVKASRVLGRLRIITFAYLAVSLVLLLLLFLFPAPW